MRSTILIVAAFALGVAPARAERPADFEAAFAAEARRADPAFAGFSAARGQHFFAATHGGRLELRFVPRQRPERAGEHAVTGKRIEPLAPAANAERFSRPASVEKWFKRNCNDVLKRPCTAQEKGDVLAWLMTLGRGECDDEDLDPDLDPFGHRRGRGARARCAVAAESPRAPLPPAYVEECGSCHVAFPGRMLDAASWSAVIAGLEQHFGVDASADPATLEPIRAYLASTARSRPTTAGGVAAAAHHRDALVPPRARRGPGPLPEGTGRGEAVRLRGLPPRVPQRAAYSERSLRLPKKGEAK